jgi:hypothetical protein
MPTKFETKIIGRLLERLGKAINGEKTMCWQSDANKV